jgi:hypothetical protein
MSYWGSTDLSSSDEFFNEKGLKEKSISLIISVNLCSIKNMIQSFNLEFHEVGKLFSHQYLHNSDFQDSIMIVLCLGVFLNDR